MRKYIAKAIYNKVKIIPFVVCNWNARTQNQHVPLLVVEAKENPKEKWNRIVCSKFFIGLMLVNGKMRLHSSLTAFQQSNGEKMVSVMEFQFSRKHCKWIDLVYDWWCTTKPGDWLSTMAEKLIIWWDVSVVNHRCRLFEIIKKCTHTETTSNGREKMVQLLAVVRLFLYLHDFLSLRSGSLLKIDSYQHRADAINESDGAMSTAAQC